RSLALICVCLALFMALYGAEYVCNSNSNNEPDCTNSSNLNVPIRNFWDPTRYWLCNSTSSTAQVVKCETLLANGTVDLSKQAFNSATKTCIAWSAWNWTPCC
ncbi:hypothetical protein KR084_004519, partial [Drosophila pseudotakahashii]